MTMRHIGVCILLLAIVQFVHAFQFVGTKSGTKLGGSRRSYHRNSRWLSSSFSTLASTTADSTVSTSITTNNKVYDAEAITVLKGLEPVRKRPGMYIGSTGIKGLHHLVFEVVDNSVDEALAGHCTDITVTLHDDNMITVQDNGRGIPCSIHPTTGKSTLETVLCVLHAGGKFGGEDSGYKVSGGLHGVGISVVNALSESLVVEVVRDNTFYTMSFAKGEPISDIIQRPIQPHEVRGTKVTFKPDSSIFKTTTTFELDRLVERLDELAYLNAGLKITIVDTRPLAARKANHHDSLDHPVRVVESEEGEEEQHKIEKVFKHDGGISELVQSLCENKTPLHSDQDIISIKEERKGVTVELAMKWSKDMYSEALSGFANGIRTSDGGSHLDGLKAAITKTVNTFAKKTGKLKEKDTSIPGEFIREGLTAVVSVKVPEPEFEGQTKTRLGNPEVRQIVDNIVTDQLTTLFEWNPTILNEICNKAMSAQAAALAAKAARDMVRRKSLLTSTVLPGKLADCASRNPQESEIYIVEGDSAAGSAKLGRDRQFQAILPLKGKILNIEKASTDKIYQNSELQALISALGLGVRGAEYDVESLRYHRIIIMTDADVDGAHIRLLLLTFFYRYQKELITSGKVYIACPPLYKVTSSKRGGSKQKEEVYLYDQEAFDTYMEQVNGPLKDSITSYTIQRFKGLGEMMPQQLWDTTMDPTRRTLKQVTIDDAAQAERMFTLCMGDAIQARREFIISNVDRMKLTDLDY